MDPHLSTQIVVSGYDACHVQYTAARSQDTAPELSLLINSLPSNATILDIGCGSGIPIASTLAGQDFRVTGVDISASQIAQARINVPSGTFIHADMLSPNINEILLAASFDGVVAMFSVFHLPRERHPEVLDRIAAWLRPGGYLLMTTSPVTSGDEESVSTVDDLSPNHMNEANKADTSVEIFYGVDMYWSSYADGWYRAMLKERGFEVLENRTFVEGQERTFSHADSKVDEGKAMHPLLFARKLE